MARVISVSSETSSDGGGSTVAVWLLAGLSAIAAILAPVVLVMNGDFAIYKWRIVQLPEQDSAEHLITLIGSFAALATSMIATTVAIVLAFIRHRTLAAVFPLMALLIGALVGVLLVQSHDCQVYYPVDECQS